MTVKAGQKCTAIRRAMAPAEYLDAVEAGARRAAGQDQGRRSARRGHAHGRVGQRQPARRRARARSPSWRRPARGSSSGDPERRAANRRRRVPAAGAAAHRRSVGARPRSTTVEPFGPVSTIMPYTRHGRRDRARQPRHGQPRAVAVHPFARRRARVRPGRGRLSWADAGHRPHQRRRIDRPRLAPAGAGPWRPRPRRRQRGDGRRARGQALHAAHRDPVVAGDDRRDHRAIYPRRAQACRSTSTRSA